MATVVTASCYEKGLLGISYLQETGLYPIIQGIQAEYLGTGGSQHYQFASSPTIQSSCPVFELPGQAIESRSCFHSQRGRAVSITSFDVLFDFKVFIHFRTNNFFTSRPFIIRTYICAHLKSSLTKQVPNIKGRVAHWA